jgi:hypothetical protein
VARRQNNHWQRQTQLAAYRAENENQDRPKSERTRTANHTAKTSNGLSGTSRGSTKKQAVKLDLDLAHWLSAAKKSKQPLLLDKVTNDAEQEI